MPPDDSPFGPDTLVTPVYLGTGPDDPGLAAWRLDHPDGFEAGVWTPAPTAPGRRREGPPKMGSGTDFAPLDPATISLADFRAVAARAKQDPDARRPPPRDPARTGETITPSPDRPAPDAPA